MNLAASAAFLAMGHLALACGDDSTAGSGGGGASSESVTSTSTSISTSTDASTVTSGDGGASTASSTDGAGGAGGQPIVEGAPELGGDDRVFTVVATAADGLAGPRDLAFAPDHPDQLWTINEDLDGIVLLTAPGTADQQAETRVDYHAEHFMKRPSALAFGIENRFASSGESRDPYNCAPQVEDDFMGPTLWSADLDVFAVIGQEECGIDIPEGSHIDMLHESPLGMGIEHETANVYWVSDGLNGHLVRYDFGDPHDPGGGFHGDGRVRRFTEAQVVRVEGVPSHLALDHATGWLYAADTGTGRVMRLDTSSGTPSGPATDPPDSDGLDEYVVMEGATWETFVDGFVEPSGLVWSAGRLFVSDHGTGEIVAFDPDGAEIARAATGAAGLMGMTTGPDGALWFVDGADDEVVRIDP